MPWFLVSHGGSLYVIYLLETAYLQPDYGYLCRFGEEEAALSRERAAWHVYEMHAPAEPQEEIRK